MSAMQSYTWYECSYPGRKNQYYCNVKHCYACCERPSTGASDDLIKDLEIDCDISDVFCFYISLFRGYRRFH